MADAKKTVTISLRLLRSKLASQDALRQDHGLDLIPSEQGELYVGQTRSHEPSWLTFVNHYASNPAELFSQSCSAVLFVKVKAPKRKTHRIFAVCFGTGHHALDPGALERNFGLRVVLNAVARDKLRTIDTATLDSTTMQRRMQASRDSDLGDFGIDANKDLMRLASGSPSDKHFASAIAGKDALTLRTKMTPADLGSRCLKALELHRSSEYKTDYSFIDHILSEKNSNILEKLDKKLFEELKSLVANKQSDLHLSLPDLISPEGALEVGFFGVGLKPGAKESFNELAIEDYVAQLQDGDFSAIKDMPTLKTSHEIRVIRDGEGDRKQKRKLYSCFVFETRHENADYVLFDGEWFKISSHFFDEVQESYEKLLKPSFLVSTPAINERELIKELETDPQLLNIDQVKASPLGAAGANIEPCDFLSKDHQFIHLKDGHGSAPLSHLWNQGIVASESFKGDRAFRKKFRDETKKRQKKFKKTGFDKLLPDGRSEPDIGKYTVVFGVMRHKYIRSKKLGLPFFSKVSLRAAAQRLDLIGYAVELHLIEKTRA